MNSYTHSIIQIHILPFMYEFIYQGRKVGFKKSGYKKSKKTKSAPPKKTKKSNKTRSPPPKKNSSKSSVPSSTSEQRGNQLLRLLFMELWKLWCDLPL